MSVKFLTYVFEKSLEKGNQRCVLLSLADSVNDEGWCWLAVKTIAKKARVSSTTARRILHDLASRKVIDIYQRINEDTGGNYSNLYLVHTPFNPNVKPPPDLIGQLELLAVPPSRTAKAFKSGEAVTVDRGGLSPLTGGTVTDDRGGLSPLGVDPLFIHQLPVRDPKDQKTKDQPALRPEIDPPVNFMNDDSKPDDIPPVTLPAAIEADLDAALAHVTEMTAVTVSHVCETVVSAETPPEPPKPPKHLDRPLDQWPPEWDSDKDPVIEAVCIAFDIQPGSYAGKLRNFLTGRVSDKAKGTLWDTHKIDDPPMKAEEIIGFSLWWDEAYEDINMPQKPETIAEKIDLYRADRNLERYLRKGYTRLFLRMKRVEPVVYAPREEVDAVYAEVDALMAKFRRTSDGA